MSNNNKSFRTTLEQKRANFAYDKANEAKNDLGEKAKDYKSYVKKMPMYIKTNGLAAALAFAFSKGFKNGEPQKNKAWGCLYLQIREWLKDYAEHLIDIKEEDRLMDCLKKVSSSEYRAISIEVLGLLMWLKRFADGLIDDK